MQGRAESSVESDTGQRNRLLQFDWQNIIVNCDEFDVYVRYLRGSYRLLCSRYEKQIKMVLPIGHDSCLLNQMRSSDKEPQQRSISSGAGMSCARSTTTAPLLDCRQAQHKQSSCASATTLAPAAAAGVGAFRMLPSPLLLNHYHQGQHTEVALELGGGVGGFFGTGLLRLKERPRARSMLPLRSPSSIDDEEGGYDECTEGGVFAEEAADLENSLMDAGQERAPLIRRSRSRTSGSASDKKFRSRSGWSSRVSSALYKQRCVPLSRDEMLELMVLLNDTTGKSAAQPLLWCPIQCRSSRWYVDDESRFE
ncbi:unnamed protein product [Anisakis simplex]|uniref:Uncharacterized protein n=1 Tax=Anisakis simplex TaxID=6269 RepID=A0A0M3K0J9_ANISI|nr:unnamed protein product [Anisakis simplex]